MRRIFCEALGNEIQLPDIPSRMVSFSPSATETLFLLGLGENVVGVSAFCARPSEARKKRVLGSYSTVDLKLLSELDPDLIFTVTGYQREFAVRLSRSFPVYALELPVSVVGIIDMILKTGLVAGASEAGRRLARDMIDSLAGVGKLSGRPRVYVEIDFGEPVTFGAFSYITDALSMLGAENIFGSEPAEWLRSDFDKVLAADPDAIIYEAKMFKPFARSDLERLLEDRNWKQLKAWRSGNVLLAPGPLDFLAHHGPAFIREAMPWLRRSLEKVRV